MRLSGFKLPVEHLSASALASFLTCPEQFRQERILKIPKRLWLDGFIGRVHHETIAENMRQKVETGYDQSLDQQMGIYRYKWAEQIESEGEPVWTEHPEKVEHLGMQMIETFHRNVAPSIKPIAVEQRFEERVTGLPVPLVGYIDTEEEAVIDEFKSAKQKVSAPKPNWRFQARIYQLVARKPVVWTVTTKQKTPVNWTYAECPDLRLPIQHPDTTVRMVLQAAEMLNDYYARYGPDSPWPTTGLMHVWACGYCSAGPKNPNPTCPAWEGSDDQIAA
jgi:hypothetical protein